MAKKILVIDDDRKIQELEKVLFTRNGFEVFTASDGTEGIRAALEYLPDLIVCDIEMPRKDGYATVIELRGHDALKNIPVIMLSALTADVYHTISASIGTVEHIDKPFDPDKLLVKVKELLG